MTECPICFKKANYTTECNHQFCKKCLYRWGDTCPLCRTHYTLKYPNTRSMCRHQHVVDNTAILLNNIAGEKESKNKIGYTEKLFQFLWDNRVYIRKHAGFCKVIYKKSVYIKKECIKLGIIPPQILKKIVLI